MKKISNIIALIIVIGLGAVYFLLGPSVLYGGPSKTAIIDITRSVMAASAPAGIPATVRDAIKIAPSGFCSKDDGKFACMVSVTMPDGTTKDFISLLKRNDAGAWEAVQ